MISILRTCAARPGRVALLLATSLVSACAFNASSGDSANAPVRSAQGVPERFEVVAPATRVQPADTVAGAGELLRLDCNTGRVIGVVRR